MLKPVIQNPSPVLHKKAEKVSDFKNQKLHKIIKDMTHVPFYPYYQINLLK